jgi:recombination associated protein RdgC
MVWLSPKDRLLVIDAGSSGKADEVITQLVRALPGLDLNLLHTATSPQTGMATWLLATDPDELPPALSIEKECVLKSGSEDQPMVKYTRHVLNTDEVRKHVREGKLPTQLGMSWEGKASFVLTEQLQLKKVSFLDGSEPDAIGAEGDDKFDADVILSTGMLGPLIQDVLAAFGVREEITGPFESVKAAQAMAKRIKMSIYQVAFDEGIPGEPIIVKGFVTIKDIQPFLVIMIVDGVIGIISMDKEIQAIDMQALPKGMIDRIKSVTKILLR